MIVVAIIGILAAVAIPGFMSYIKNSKTSEAKTNLDAIRKGAVSYFEAEHYTPDGMSATSKQYPVANTAKVVGTTPSASTVGVKQSPSATAVTTALGLQPYKALNFTLTSPFYYTYSYIADGSNVVCTVTEGTETCAPAGGAAATYQQSHFRANACASLNADKDSIFTIAGDQNGNVGAVVEETNKGKCVAPTI